MTTSASSDAFGGGVWNGYGGTAAGPIVVGFCELPEALCQVSMVCGVLDRWIGMKKS